MKKGIFAVLLILLFSVTANADVCFEWSDNSNANADYMEIYLDEFTNVVGANVPVTETSYCVPEPTDGLCHNYWARNANAAGYSANSDVAVWCPDNAVTPDPPVQLPTSPSSWIITVTPQ